MGPVRPSQWVLAVLLAGTIAVAPAQAIFMRTAAARVDEVPVDRLLANLDRNSQGLAPADRARAIGRIHLLAYVKGTMSLPVYRDNPAVVVEGPVDDCTKLDPDPPLTPPPVAERCAVPTYSLEPDREIPSGTRRPGSGDGHLQAAITAYLDARALDPTNLRTRLALAYAFDQAGQPEGALQELRFVAEEGLQQLPQPARGGQASADWELHVVLGEAREHLARLARAERDQRLARDLQARLDAVRPAIAITPILVPLKPTQDRSLDGLVERRSGVTFDFSGQGLPMRAGWLTADAAWLVWDPLGHGDINGGFQLFGSVTWMAFWTNGYHALGTLDDDGDGRVAGSELAGLALWHDRNANGASEPGEVRPVTAYGIEALSYAHERAAAEFWMSPRGVTFSDGRTWATYDWLVRSGRIQGTR